jgi:hypothetical protein
MKKTILFFVCLLIIIIGVGGYLIYKEKNKTSQISKLESTNNSTNNQEPSTELLTQKAEEAIPVVRELEPGKFSDITTYTFKGITFALPWSNLTKRTDGEPSLNLKFDEKTVAFLEKEKVQNEIINLFLEDFKSKEKKDQLESLFGSKNFESTYNFLSFVYGITSNVVSDTSPGPKQEIEKILLKMKEVIVVGGTGDDGYIIYNFKTVNIKGFQYGSKGSTGKIIDIFDNNNNSYTLLVKNVSQPEIDYILSSIKPK